jgi:hypothetical protein
MKVHDLLAEDALGSLGWDLIVAKVEAGTMVAIKKETIVEMCNERAIKTFDLSTQRHAILESILPTTEFIDNTYPTAHFLMPCKTSAWITVNIEMEPSLQEGWMMQKLGKGWLAWREV